MNDFDPGPGWQNVQFEDETPVGTVAYREEDGSWSYWVREVPVPPLPTVQYTVIRVTWRDEDRRPTDEWAFFGGDWVDVDGEAFSANYLHQRITSFEIVSEPPAVTAKAVIDALMAGKGMYSARLEDIARDFGVES